MPRLGRNRWKCPTELCELLERSKAYGEKGGGTFDVTWHGMAHIWHFDDKFVVPTQAAVDAARRNIDFSAIQIAGNRVFLPRAGMSIGLGGIAKGYAIDRASAVLARAGFAGPLFDCSGDVLGKRERGGGTPGGRWIPK